MPSGWGTGWAGEMDKPSSLKANLTENNLHTVFKKIPQASAVRVHWQAAGQRLAQRQACSGRTLQGQAAGPPGCEEA